MDDTKKQTLVIGYANSGVMVKTAGANTDARVYRGLIYVKVFPISPDLVKRYGAGPVVSAELQASGRTVNQLPLGEYEVRYGMRTGSEIVCRTGCPCKEKRSQTFVMIARYSAGRDRATPTETNSAVH